VKISPKGASFRPHSDLGTIAKPLSMAALNTALSLGSASTSSAALKGAISCHLDRGLGTGRAVTVMA
jgi:hypothetical protein